MMYCRDCVDLLADYLDGSLPEEKKSAFEEHLSYCPPCIAFLRTYRATSKICRKKLETNIPEEVSARLHDFLAKNCTKKQPS